MKIKRSQLKNIIKEEIKNILLKEGPWDDIIRGGRRLYRSLTRPGRLPHSTPELPQGTIQTDDSFDVARDIVDQDLPIPLAPDDPEYWRRQHRADVDVPEEGGDVIDFEELQHSAVAGDHTPGSASDQDALLLDPIPIPDPAARRAARNREVAVRRTSALWDASDMDQDAIARHLANSPDFPAAGVRGSESRFNVIRRELDVISPQEIIDGGWLTPAMMRPRAAPPLDPDDILQERLYKEIERILNENI